VLAILQITFPFFALVLAGYVAIRKGWLPMDAIGGLNAFVLYFALPCMLFRFGSGTPISKLLDAPLVITYLLCQTLMVGCILLTTLSQRIRWNDGAFGALVTSFPNTGYMGVPLLVALLGERAVGPAIVTILVDLVITSSACVALSRLDTPGGAGVALRNAAKGVLSNPMPWAILTGALASFTQLQLPTMVGNTVGLLADCASPVALFTIGAVLGRSALLARQDTSHHVPMADYLPLALVKLLLHPALVLLVGLGLKQAGLPVDAFSLTVVTLVAALPSASNVTLLSEKFGANTARLARVIMASTALAFLSFSGAVALLTNRPL
jgi:malonate transporter and related proteins